MSDEIPYPELYTALYEYCENVISSLGDHFDPDSIPQRTRWEVVDTEDGQTEHQQVPEPDYFHLIASQKDTLSAFSGYSRCVETLLSNELMKEQLPRVTDDEGNEVEDPDHEPWIRIETLTRILSYYLEKKDELVYDDKVFKEVYLQFVQYLEAEELEAQSWAVLDRFDMEPERLILKDDLRIREITDDERGFLVGQSRAILTPVSHRDIHGSHVLEFDYTVPKNEGRSTTLAKKTFNNVTLALRLFPNGGDTRYLTLISDQSSPFEGGGNRHSPGESSTPSLRNSCELTLDDCDMFKEFWERHEEQLFDPPRSMRIALRRYADAFQRREPEDRLVDLVIALEAMLLKPGEFQELAFRLSQRGALLLPGDLEDAREIRSQLKDAYRDRSKVVHGVRDEVDRQFVNEVEELTRRCVLEVLERAPRGGKEHEAILDKLDEEALDSK